MLKLAAYTLAIVACLGTTLAGYALVNALRYDYPAETVLAMAGAALIGIICCLLAVHAAEQAR